MKYLTILLLCTLFILLPSLAYAITTPNTISIYEPVQVYRNVLDTDDTLFVAKYNISYTSLPSETAAEAFIVRVLDGNGTPIGSILPYAFHTYGYGDGVFSVYFEPGVITWASVYSVELAGNPLLDWTDDVIPKYTATEPSWYSSNSGFGTYILQLARELSATWGTPYNLEEVGMEGSTKLTALGATYFSTVIPNLRVMSPGIFAISTLEPEFERRTYTKSYETELLGVWDATQYSGYFDDLADFVTTDTGTLKLVIFSVVVVATMMVVLQQVSSGWILPILLTPLLYFGNWSGLIPVGLTALTAFAFLLMGVLAVVYRRTTA